jgi:flagellar protein FlbT
MHISLRAGERIYVNGAVLRVDRKVSIELLNDATFLLEAHVMRVEDATTPLRQLYFIVQIMLMNPGDTAAARDMFDKSISLTAESFENNQIITTLKNVKQSVETNRNFEALKMIRTLLPIEAEIMTKGKTAPPTQAA